MSLVSFIAAVEAAIVEEQDAIYAEATALADTYRWRMYDSYRNGGKAQACHYLPTVRKRRAGVDIYWGRLAFRGPKGQRKMFIQQIARGATTTRYATAKFSKAPFWELEGIVQAENRFEDLRRASALVSKTAHLIRTSKALSHKETSPDGSAGHGDGTTQETGSSEYVPLALRYNPDTGVIEPA